MTKLHFGQQTHCIKYCRSFQKVLCYFCCRRTRTTSIFKKIAYCIIFISGFVYLNFKCNLPVFHAFRNPNIMAPCILPSYDIYDKSVDEFFWEQQPLPCENWLDLFYVDSNGFVTMNKSAVTKSGYTKINCGYRYVELVSQSKIKFSSRRDYVRPTYIEGDVIHVDCYDNAKQQIYNNLHINIDSRTVFRNRHLATETKSNLSVFIIGIDSLSRLIAERKLPKTLNYIKKELDAYMFKGYTRVGDGSYPNLLPLFTGLKAYGEEYKVGVDNIHYMFNNFTERGSIDLYAEDWYKVAF